MSSVPSTDETALSLLPLDIFNTRNLRYLQLIENDAAFQVLGLGSLESGREIGSGRKISNFSPSHNNNAITYHIQIANL